jgi:hypothetical protein
MAGVILPNGRNYFSTSLGAPLIGGRVYAFVPGTSTPKDTYTTSAASTPNTHPIVLDVRGEAAIYWTGDYDVVLKDSSDVLIWGPERLNQPETAGSTSTALADLASTTDAAKGAAMVGFGPTIAYTSGVGSILRYAFGRTAAEIAAGVTPTNYGYAIGDVRRYGADSTGATVSKTAFRNAFAANKTVVIPDGTWDMGSMAGGEFAVDLRGLGDGINIVTGKGALLKCTTTGASGKPYFFWLDNNSNFTCGDINFQDLGYDSSVTWKGAIGFYMTNATPVSWGNINIRSIRCKNLVAPLEVQSVGTPSATLRIRGIKIGHIEVDDCYYGLSLQNEGDATLVDLIAADQCLRPLFVYGVSGVRANVFGRRNRSTSGAINISRSVGGLNTRDIKINYTSKENANNIAHVIINHLDLLGGEISDVDISLNIESSVAYTPVRFVNYNGAGAETGAASTNIVDRITIRGQTDANAGSMGVTAAYPAKGLLNLGLNATAIPPTALTTAFNLGLSGTAAATWTSNGTPPALGNGTLAQTYTRTDDLLYVHTSLTIGSSTTFGTGIYSFSLPATTLLAAVGQAWIKDTSGPTHHRAVAFAEPGQTTFQVYPVDAGSATGPTSPMTWATGDRMEATIVFRIG